MKNKSKSPTAVLNFKKRKVRKLVQKQLEGTIRKIKSLEEACRETPTLKMIEGQENSRKGAEFHGVLPFA